VVYAATLACVIKHACPDRNTCAHQRISTLFMERRKSMMILGEACGILEVRNSNPRRAASPGTQYSASSCSTQGVT
jgi:hypothetical protein